MKRLLLTALILLGCQSPTSTRAPSAPTRTAPPDAPAQSNIQEEQREFRLILDLAEPLHVDRVDNAALVALPPSAGTHNAPLLLAPDGARVAKELEAAESVSSFTGGSFPAALVAEMNRGGDYVSGHYQDGHWIRRESDPSDSDSRPPRPEGYTPAPSKLSNCPSHVAHTWHSLQLADGARIEIGDDCESDLYQELLGGAKDYDAPLKQTLEYWPKPGAPSRVSSVPVYEITQLWVSPKLPRFLYVVARSSRGESPHHQDVVRFDLDRERWEEIRFPEDVRGFCMTEDGVVWAQDEATVFYANPKAGRVVEARGFWEVPVLAEAWTFQVMDVPRYNIRGTELPPFPNRLSCVGNHAALEANLTSDHHLLFWTGPTDFVAPLRSR